MNKFSSVHISTLKQGDTVMIDGQMETVSQCNIKNGFTGWTYKGDPFYKNKGFITVMLFPKWLQGHIERWQRQI